MSDRWIPHWMHVQAQVSYYYWWGLKEKTLSLNFFIYRSIAGIEEEFNNHVNFCAKNAKSIYKIGAKCFIDYTTYPVTEEKKIPFDYQDQSSCDREEIENYFQKLVTFKRRLGCY